jgi:hypothetical protein
MTAFKRETDPTQVLVQLNFKVPWQVREDMVVIAERKNMSFAGLAREALMKGLRDDLTQLGRERTRDAGATS